MLDEFFCGLESGLFFLYCNFSLLFYLHKKRNIFVISCSGFGGGGGKANFNFTFHLILPAYGHNVIEKYDIFTIKRMYYYYYYY